MCVILFYFSKLKLYGHLNCGHNIDVKSPTIAQPSANWVLTYFDFSHFTSFHTKTTPICLIDLPLRRYRTPSCSLISEEQSHFGGVVVFRRSGRVSEESLCLRRGSTFRRSWRESRKQPVCVSEESWFRLLNWIICICAISSISHWKEVANVVDTTTTASHPPFPSFSLSLFFPFFL